MKIEINVNGKPHHIDKEQIPHLKALITSMVKNDKGLIVELNETIVNRNHWHEKELNPKDNIELINLVGGG